MTDKNNIPVLPEYVEENKLIEIKDDPTTLFEKVKDFFRFHQNFIIYSGKPFSMKVLLFKVDLYGIFKIKLYQKDIEKISSKYYLEVRLNSGDSTVAVKGLQICQALLNGDDPNMIKLKKDITPLPVPKELLVDIHIEDPKTEDILFYLNSEYDDELYDRIKFVHNIYDKFIPNRKVTDRLIEILNNNFFGKSKLVIVDLLLKKPDWIKTLSASQKIAIQLFVEKNTDKVYSEHELLNNMIQRYANILKEKLC